MKVAVVGSGPAGVAASRALVDSNVRVDMLDFGNVTDAGTDDLSDRLRRGADTTQDRIALKSKGLESLSAGVAALTGRGPFLNLLGKKRLGSLFTYRDVDWGIPMIGNPIARSLARGGLSNIWGASCYPLGTHDYGLWPLGNDELTPHYAKVADLLHLNQAKDDLSDVYPTPGRCHAPMPLNERAHRLLEHWQAHRSPLRAAGFRFGRARLAVRTSPTASGETCERCGLCLTGCPYDAIYRADWTLDQLRSSENFTYRSGFWLHRFVEHEAGVTLQGVNQGTGESSESTYDALFLACGALSSLRVVADSMALHDTTVPLWDNDLYLVPFLSDTAHGPSVDFTLNELALSLQVHGHPVHAQFYCVSDQVLEQLGPLTEPLRRVFARPMKHYLDRLFLGFIYLPSRSSARLQARVRAGDPVGTVDVTQSANESGRALLRAVMRHFRYNRKALGLRPIGPAMRSTPAGNSGGHVSGGLPMRGDPTPLTTSPEGRVSGTRSVWAVDGSVLPALPAQNSTFTIMANAHRIGHEFAKGRHTAGATRAFAFGKQSIADETYELDHNKHQYETSALTARYHRHVLKQCAATVTLTPGMHVLDYGCGHQHLRPFLPAGVRYTGYDLNARLTDVLDPTASEYDVVFCLQVLMYLTDDGLRAWAEQFAQVTSQLVIMVPARNFLKDEVFDRLFGLHALRTTMVRSDPETVYRHLDGVFTRRSTQTVLQMGEITLWERDDPREPAG